MYRLPPRSHPISLPMRRWQFNRPRKSSNNSFTLHPASSFFRQPRIADRLVRSMTLRRRMPSVPATKSTSEPGSMPNCSRNSFGIVICPFVVTRALILPKVRTLSKNRKSYFSERLDSFTGPEAWLIRNSPLADRSMFEQNLHQASRWLRHDTYGRHLPEIILRPLRPSGQRAIRKIALSSRHSCQSETFDWSRNGNRKPEETYGPTSGIEPKCPASDLFDGFSSVLYKVFGTRHRYCIPAAHSFLFVPIVKAFRGPNRSPEALLPGICEQCTLGR